MGRICNKCKNSNGGKCEIYGVNTYEISDNDIREHLYDCFISKKGVSADEEFDKETLRLERLYQKILRLYGDCKEIVDVYDLSDNMHMSLEALKEYEYSLEPEANEDDKYEYYKEGTYKMGEHRGKKDRSEESWEIDNKSQQYKDIKYISSNYGGEMTDFVKRVKNIKI